jgi:two-component system, response regulator YesN
VSTVKKVMLVDDEILIRETIRDCIDWEQEGYLFCGDASDGEVALPMIEELRPDIVITDVMMPFMDGLELSALIRQRYPEIKIIILSGHGEFEYARRALRMGVEEYCLKPVSSSDILHLLKEVSEKIDRERDEKRRIDRMKQREAESKTVSQDKLLNDLCSGFLSASDAIHLSSSLSLSLVARFYVVAIADSRDSEQQPSNGDLLRSYLQLQEQLDVLMCKRSRTENVWIFKGDTLEQLHQQLAPVKELQRMAADTPSGVGGLVTIGIGTVQERLQGVHLSFLDAEEDMHWRRLSRQNRHDLWETTSDRLDPTVFLDRGRFVDFLRIGTPAKLDSFVQDYASGLRELDWQASPIGYYILNDLTLEVFRAAKDMYRNVEAPEQLVQPLQEQIGTIHSFSEACAFLTKLTEQFWAWRSRTNDKYGDMLRKVKDYIQENYDKDYISLQDAAEHVKVSPSHLSKVFSQETGQTFIEYLTQTRMKKAMELLRSTSAKSYEIAFQVGYNDSHYFSNLFKRVTGMTTKEFRKSGMTTASYVDGEEAEALDENE